jgi:serine protease inhibitor
MKQRLKQLTILSLSVFMISCNPSHLFLIPKEEEINKLLKSEVTASINNLSFKLISEIYKNDKQSKIFISPLNIALGINMIYNASEGKTKKEIEELMSFNNININNLNEANSILKRLIKNQDPKVEVKVANSIWFDKSFKLRDEFSKVIKESYQGNVETLDFKDSSTPRKINSWFDSNTDGKIKNVLENISNEEVMLLLNAMYFKGDWTEKFDKSKTKDDDFNLDKNNKIKVPMMNIYVTKANYIETDKFQAVRLYYGDKKFSMYIFLPKEDSDISEFMKDLSLENWKEWLKVEELQQGTVIMPKYKIEYESELNEVLKNLGLKTAFIKDTNCQDKFQNAIIPNDEICNLYITKAKQKTEIEVNEDGSEIVTKFEFRFGLEAPSVPERPKEFSIKIDRPFFCSVLDNKTGTIMFTGIVNNPQKNNE